MKMEKINEKDVDGIEKMLNGSGGVGNMKTMLKPKSSSSGTMINGTIHEELETHMNPCNYLMVDELGVAGNPVMPTRGDSDSGGGGGGPFAAKQKLQSGSTQNGTSNLIQIPIPMHHRSSRSIRSLKRPQPQPHICILDKTVDNLDVYINVLSWTRIVKPEKTNDPIPLYGGMRVMSGSVTYKPLLIYAVTVNPIVLENTKRLCGNLTAQQSLMTLMVDFVEAMNPDLKLKRQPKILIDRDLTGELKEIWLALHSKRERDKFRVLEESYYLYEEFGPPAPATTSPSTTNECDEQAEENEAGDERVALDNYAHSDSNTLNSSSSSQDKIDHKGMKSDTSSTTSSVPFTNKPTTKGNECDSKTQTMNEKNSPSAESTVTSCSLKGSSSTSSGSGGKIKSPSDEVTPSPQTTLIQNTKNRTSHIPILGIKDNKDKDYNKDNKENKEKEKKDKSGGDQSPIQRSIDFLAGISFFKSKTHENGASGGGNGAAGSGGNSSNSNHSADSNNPKSNGGNSKKKDKNSNSNSSSSNSKQQPSSKQQHGVRNSNNVSNDSSSAGRSDKINSISNSSNSNDFGGGE